MDKHPSGGVATLDSSLCDALREASLRAALEALSAAWREEVHDRGPCGPCGPCTAPRWPEDVDGRTWSGKLCLLVSQNGRPI